MSEFLPGYEMTSWTIRIGPAGIRGDVIERANALTVTALADNAVKKRYAELGATVWPTTPDEARAYRDKEETRLLPIMFCPSVCRSRLRKRGITVSHCGVAGRFGWCCGRAVTRGTKAPRS